MLYVGTSQGASTKEAIDKPHPYFFTDVVFSSPRDYLLEEVERKYPSHAQRYAQGQSVIQQ